MSETMTYFKKCNSCKKEVAFNSTYYVCSVSTCNSQRTGLTFCSVSCFERHVPGARHKDAAAIEKKAPSSAPPTTSTSSASEGRPRRRIISSPPTSHANHVNSSSQVPSEVLIVASKLKNYIKVRSDMNTSASVIDILSEKVRRLCDEAIDQARSEGRKTVLDRDFK